MKQPRLPVTPLGVRPDFRVSRDASGIQWLLGNAEINAPNQMHSQGAAMARGAALRDLLDMRAIGVRGLGPNTADARPLEAGQSHAPHARPKPTP